MAEKFDQVAQNSVKLYKYRERMKNKSSQNINQWPLYSESFYYLFALYIYDIRRINNNIFDKLFNNI